MSGYSSKSADVMKEPKCLLALGAAMVRATRYAMNYEPCSLVIKRSPEVYDILNVVTQLLQFICFNIFPNDSL